MPDARERQIKLLQKEFAKTISSLTNPRFQGELFAKTRETISQVKQTAKNLAKPTSSETRQQKNARIMQESEPPFKKVLPKSKGEAAQRRMEGHTNIAKSKFIADPSASSLKDVVEHRPHSELPKESKPSKTPGAKVRDITSSRKYKGPEMPKGKKLKKGKKPKAPKGSSGGYRYSGGKFKPKGIGFKYPWDL